MCAHSDYANVTYKTERNTDLIIAEYCKGCGALSLNPPFGRWKKGDKNKLFGDLAHHYGLEVSDLTVWFLDVVGKKVTELSD